MSVVFPTSEEKPLMAIIAGRCIDIGVSILSGLVQLYQILPDTISYSILATVKTLYSLNVEFASRSVNLYSYDTYTADSALRF